MSEAAGALAGGVNAADHAAAGPNRPDRRSRDGRQRHGPAGKTKTPPPDPAVREADDRARRRQTTANREAESPLKGPGAATRPGLKPTP